MSYNWLFIDIGRAQNISRIFIEMADTFLNHMVHQPSVGLGSLVTLDLLLESVSHPDYEVTDWNTKLI